MKLRKATYLALGALVSAASCSKEAAEPNPIDWTDGEIFFKTSLADVKATKAEDMTLENLESFQVTCFNTGDQTLTSPYFEDTPFIRSNQYGLSYACKDGTKEWPQNDGDLLFFAFSPAREDMGAENGIEMPDGYRLEKIRVNSDISKQFDFITANAKGNRKNDFAKGVELAFRHQLSQVELRAWGNNADYEYEIAGVRIGNPVVEDSFIFAEPSEEGTNEPRTSFWEGSKVVKERVDHVYTALQEEKGDKIFRINDTEHNTLESAGSIMGLGGCAMVIPTKNEKWLGLDDPEIEGDPYKTDKMYFSILMRVTAKNKEKVIYPYPNDKTGMTVVTLQTDDGETKDFGWAAVPVEVDWSAGKRYVYTLNYSEGIGLHDPEDPKPGTPIGSKTSISWSVNVVEWDNNTEENKVTVPRK